SKANSRPTLDGSEIATECRVAPRIAGSTGRVPLADEVEELLTERVAAGHRERAPPRGPVPRRELGGADEVPRGLVVATRPMQERADAPMKPCELILRRRRVLVLGDGVGCERERSVPYPGPELLVVN